MNIYPSVVGRGHEPENFVADYKGVILTEFIGSLIRPRPIDFESKKVENLFTVEMALGFNQSAGITISTSTSFQSQAGIHYERRHR